MASVVEIQIKVDAAQAGPAIDSVNQKLSDMGVKGSATVRQASGALDGATASMGRAGAAAGQMGGHVATSLDSVRLLSQEFGLRMPRAIEAMLSRMPAVTGVLNSMLGVMTGVAGVEIFTRVIEGATEAYDKFFSLNAIIDKYNEGIEKARQADLPNARDIETLQLRLQTQTGAGAQAHSQAGQLHDQGWDELMQRTMSPADIARAGLLGPLNVAYNAARGGIDMHLASQQGETANKADVARDELDRKRIELTHEETLAQIELNHAQDASLVGMQKLNAEAQKKKDISAEERKYQTSADKSFGNATDPNAGAAAQRARDRMADAELAAQKTILARETDLAITKSNDARIQAGLQGEELYRRKMQDDIRETTLELTNQGKAAEIPARTQEIMEKYFDDLSTRAVKSQSELAAMNREAAMAGLTGAARIEAERESTVSANNTKYAADPEMEHAANVAAAAEANGKLLELQKNFSEQMRAISESQTTSAIGGYARIDAEAAKVAADIRDKFQKVWAGADPLAFPLDGQKMSPLSMAQGDAQGALDAVGKGAAQKKMELAQQMSQETLRYDQQAAQAERRVKSDSLLGWVSDYKGANDEIRAQEAERIADLDREYSKGEVDWDNYCQRLKDVHAEAQSEITAQNQQTERAIASQLEQAFSNPIDFIKRRMEQMMMEIFANWLMHLKMFQGVFGQTMGGAQSGSGGGGGIMGVILGGGRSGRSGASAPTDHSVSGATSGGTYSGGVAAPSISSSASFSGSPSIVSQIPSAISDVAHYGGGTAAAHSASGGAAPARSAYTGGVAGPSISGGTSVGGGGTADTHGAYSGGVASPSISGGSQASDGSPSVMSQIPEAFSDVAKYGGGSSAANSSASGGTDSSANDVSTQGGIAPAGTSGTVDDGTGNMTLSGEIPSESQPDYKVPAANATGAGAAGYNEAMRVGAAGMGAYEGYSDTVADYKSGTAGGTLKGMLGDAAAGAAIGSIIPGVGTVVGAVVGAAVGLVAGVTGAIMGEGGRIKARDYYKKTLFPEMEAQRNSDGTDWQTAISNVNRIASDGMVYMAEHWGSTAAQWVNDNYLKKEQKLADSEIEARAKGGSYAVTMSASQFHSGGLISGFGSFGTGGDEGFVHARLGEAVMNPGAVSMHGPAIGAMNGGASPADMARMYLAGSSGSGGSSGTTHNHNYGGVSVSTMDSKSFDRFLASGDNARTVVKHVNKYSTQYAGDGVSG